MRRTMTEQQLEQIAALRKENYPYSFIGRELGLSPNTVKSICQRKGFAASKTGKLRRSGLDFSRQESDEWWQEVKIMRIEEIPASPKKPKVTRVAAYARVSSDKDAAFHSLEAQTEYYQNYIAARPDWELVAIYSDNGISGTTIHRPEFQRMLQDCREGKIDLIITKSVTRFARNTIILLETIRELKKIGVECYFEKEDMHSISPDGELLLTLLAMYAEEEARSASENQKWRIQKLYDQGKPAGGHTFGYRLAGERFEVVPEEAEIVKEIFRLYLSGMGYSKIARTLIERHGTWSVASVRNILLNEKYAGDLLLQKTFSEDFRTKKKRKNTGEVRKVYVKNSHEAIIDRQTFEAVQQEIARRSARPAAALVKERLWRTEIPTTTIVKSYSLA